MYAQLCFNFYTSGIKCTIVFQFLYFRDQMHLSNGNSIPCFWFTVALGFWGFGFGFRFGLGWGCWDIRLGLSWGCWDFRFGHGLGCWGFRFGLGWAFGLDCCWASGRSSCSWGSSSDESNRLIGDGVENSTAGPASRRSKQIHDLTSFYNHHLKGKKHSAFEPN